MRQVVRVLVAFCVLALVVALCGCGGSGGSAGPSVGSAGKPAPPPPSVPAGTLVGDGLYTMNTNGTGRTFLTSGMMPCWSPNGQQVCFTSLSNRLYTVPRSGGTPTQFTTDVEPGLPGGYDYYPAWSPDGQRIAFERLWYDENGTRAFIAVKDWPNGPARLITSGGVYRDEHPTWSPDGQYVLFNRLDEAPYARLMVVAADGGGEPYPVTADISVSGTSDWYRDSATGENWIVYDSGSVGLYRLQVDAAGHALGIRIALPNGGHSSYFRFPSWSPDGKFVAFDTEEATKKGAVVTTYILEVATSALYKVGDLRNVDWAPQ